MKRWILIFAIGATSASAQDSANAIAQDQPVNPAPRDLCSELGGLDTPACIVDPHHLQIETGISNWTLDTSGGQRKDTVSAGDILLRYGVIGTLEIRVAGTAYRHVRTRDFSTGEIENNGGIGDITLSAKQSLSHPAEGKTGLAIALLPYVQLPAGKRNVGAGDWGTGLIIPTSYKLSDTVSLEMTPEVDAAVNESGSGRHLAYGSAFGVQMHLGKKILLTPELQVIRDDDPEHHMMMARASLSFDVQTDKNTLLDLNAVAGLDHDTPDVALAWGVTRKF